MKKSILILLVSSITLILNFVFIKNNINNFNIITFLLVGALLPMLLVSIMGTSIINLAKIKKDSIKILFAGVISVLYTGINIFFIKFINIDFNIITQNSKELANNTSLQISEVSSQSFLASGVINLFLVFAFIVIFTKMIEKIGENYV